MTDLYVLDAAGEPTPCEDMDVWARIFEKKSGRIVKQEQIGESLVSTVFLGLDHGWHHLQGAPPILWETMVFGGPLDHEMTRCGGMRADAMMLHEAMVERVKANRGA